MRVNKKLFKAFGGEEGSTHYEVSFVDISGGLIMLFIAALLSFWTLTWFTESNKEIQFYKDHCSAIAGDKDWFIARNNNSSDMACNIIINKETQSIKQVNL